MERSAVQMHVDRQQQLQWHGLCIASAANNLSSFMIFPVYFTSAIHDIGRVVCITVPVPTVVTMNTPHNVGMHGQDLCVAKADELSGARHAVC